MTITVFTPTYNRAYILPQLYESLCDQTNKSFEWVVVDDGSQDETEKLFKEWNEKPDFPIKYTKVQNGGKHRAVNIGARVAEGELFYIVDSDDRLPADAISTIIDEYTKVRDRYDLCGICGLKVYFSGEKVGGEQEFVEIDCNSLDFRYKYKIKGDMAEVFKTSVIREFPFPEIEGENFCPEAVVWQRVASKYKFHYFYRKIYLCEYLPDGLSAKITKIRMQCPVSSTICYSELIQSEVPLVQKIRASINYWRFWFCPSIHKKPTIPFLWWLALL